MNTSNILLGKHHDITAFASKDPARYTINGVHYNAAKQVLEATDGAILIRVPVVQDESGEFPPVSVNGSPADCIIPIGPFKKALGNVPKSQSLSIAEHMRLSVSSKPFPDGSENKQVNLCTTDLETEQNVATKPVEGTFPNIDQVIPTEPAKFSITIGSQLLKQIAEYAEKHGKDEGSRGGACVRFDFTDSTSAIRFSFQLATALGLVTKAEGVAMPMRMS